MGRALLVGVAFGAVVLLGTAAPVSADDLTPAPAPTPSVSVSPPSPQQIEDARTALDRLRHAGTATPTALTEVAGPVTPERRRRITPRISDEGWWTIGAGLLVVLVLSETTRLKVRRAKHRKRA